MSAPRIWESNLMESIRQTGQKIKIDLPLVVLLSLELSTHPSHA